MIHSLRRRHRAAWRLLALLLPAAFVAALAVRPPADIVQLAPVDEALRGGPSVAHAAATVAPATAPAATAAAAQAATAAQAAGASTGHAAPALVLRLDGQAVATCSALRSGPQGDQLDVQCGELPALPGLQLLWMPRAAPVASGPGAAASRTAVGTLPSGSVLLGPLVARGTGTYTLPAAARTTGGSLALYSLGHQQLVGDSVALDATAPGLDAPSPDADATSPQGSDGTGGPGSGKPAGTGGTGGTDTSGGEGGR